MLKLKEAAKLVAANDSDKTITSAVETHRFFVFNNPPKDKLKAFDQLVSVNKVTGEIKPYPANNIFMQELRNAVIEKYTPEEVDKLKKEYFE